MVGGWMSFSGIDGRARYHDTPLEQALPVTCTPWDDRAERPEGVVPDVIAAHPVLDGVSEPWPSFSATTRSSPEQRLRSSSSLVLIHCWRCGRTAQGALPRSRPTVPRTGDLQGSWSGRGTPGSGATSSSGSPSVDASRRSQSPWSRSIRAVALIPAAATKNASARPKRMPRKSHSPSSWRCSPRWCSPAGC